MNTQSLEISTRNLRKTQPNLNPSDFQFEVTPAIQLGSMDWEVALYSASMILSVPNFENKVIHYTTSGSGAESVTIPSGYYTLSDINTLLNEDVIAKGGSDGDITLTPNLNTNRVQLSLTAGSELDLSQPNNIAFVLGFTESNFTSSQSGTSIAQFNSYKDVPYNRFEITCDLLQGSFSDGRNGQTIYAFSPVSPPTGRIIETPVVLKYGQVSKSTIDRIRIRLLDDNGRVLDMQGEDLVLTLVIKRM